MAQSKYGPGIVIAVSEGICGKNRKPINDSGITDDFGNTIPGGAAQILSTILLKNGIKSRSEKPGLIGRASKFSVSEVDRDEAFRAGQESLKAATQGKSGYMIGFKRVSKNQYKIDLELTPLGSVANAEKLLPDNFINKAGNDVTGEFIDYCRPLIGRDIEGYFKFDK